MNTDLISNLNVFVLWRKLKIKTKAQGAEFRKIMIQRCYVEVIFNQSSLFSGFSSSPPSEPRETGAKRIFLKNIFWLSVNHEVKGHGQIPQLTLNYLLSK